MGDELSLGHAERSRDPAEEPDVGAEVEVDEAADGGGSGGVVVALVGEVELGEVDAVVDGLDAEEGEEEEEDEGAEDVDEGGDAKVLQRRHCCSLCLAAAAAFLPCATVVVLEDCTSGEGKGRGRKRKGRGGISIDGWNNEQGRKKKLVEMEVGREISENQKRRRCGVKL